MDPLQAANRFWHRPRDEPDLTMTIYASESGSATKDAFKLLASWAATTTQEQAPAKDQRTP